jgi:DNA-binding HxlR family transcriptional regulator
LEADGVVVRHVYAEVPPKVEYRLSELGQTLVPVLLAMRDWGSAYKKKNREQAEAG